jgi:hypothetical protein
MGEVQHREDGCRERAGDEDGIDGDPDPARPENVNRSPHGRGYRAPREKAGESNE